MSILQMLQNQSQVQAQPDLMSKVNMIKEIMSSGMNPDEVARQMSQNNPNFKRFLEINKGKSPEQIAAEYGIKLK